MKKENAKNIAGIVAFTTGNEVSFEEFDIDTENQIREIYSAAGRAKSLVLREYVTTITNVIVNSERGSKTYDAVLLVMIEEGLDKNSGPDLVVQYIEGEREGEKTNLPISRISKIVVVRKDE